MTENDRISLEGPPMHVSEGTSETLEDPIEDTLEEGPPLVAAIEPEAHMAERAIASRRLTPTER